MSTPIAEQLIAHRGWQRRYPENTLVGIEGALQAGARHVEIDIQLTADQVPVLCHDVSLQRVCGVNRKIFALDWADLGRYSAFEPTRLGQAFAGTPLSTLADCVALMAQNRHATLYVEIKEESLRHFGTDIVLRRVLAELAPIRDHCYLISFDMTVLEQARRAGWRAVAPVLRRIAQLDETAMTELAPALAFCNVKLLRGVKPGALAYPLAVYEIDRLDTAQRLLRQGVALVETFAVGELIAADREARHV